MGAWKDDVRIAYLTQSYPPMVSGAAITVERLAAGMAGRGHQVLVLAASDEPWPYRFEKDGLIIDRMRSHRNPARANQRFLAWPSRQVRMKLQAFRPHLVHLHEPLNLGLCGLSAAQGLDIPIVLTLHQLPWFMTAYLPSSPGLRTATERILWGYGGWFVRHCTGMVAPTHIVANLLYERTGKQAEVIGYGVDLARFRPGPGHPEETAQLRSRYGIHPSRPVILHVGRLDQDKRTDLVLAASVEVLARLDAQLLLVGDGARKKVLMAQSAKLGIADRVIFPGFVERQQTLPGLYQLASVFITASEIETQGVVLLEALASGLPVIAVRAGAVPELIEDGVNGFLLPPGSVEGMAHRLARILTHPAEARKLGAAGFSTAARYRRSAYLEGHERLYRRCLARYRQQGRASASRLGRRPASHESSAKGRASQRNRQREALIAAAMAALAMAWPLYGPITEFLTFIADRPAFTAFILGYGYLGPFVLALLQLFQVVVSLIPGHAVVMTAGYLYGLIPGFLFNWLSIGLSGLIPFFLARRYGRPVAVRLAPARILDQLDAKAEAHGFAFFFSGFLLPIFPADTMNYAAGLSSLPGWKFFLASLFGRAPGTLLFTALGAYGMELAGLPIPTWGWGLIATTLLVLYWTWHARFRDRPTRAETAASAGRAP